MAAARLLLTISALLSLTTLQVVYGEIDCEKLPAEICAFSVSSSGARCVLQKSILMDGNVQYECQTSDVMAESLNELIETEECMKACGVERMTVGMSAESLVEGVFTKKLCSPGCYNNCLNIIDFYFNVAAGKGVYLPRLCEDHRSRDQRMTTVSGRINVTGILARLKVETRMGQGREIVGGKSSSFTPPSFEYSSINHTISEYKEPSLDDQKAVEQVIVKELVHLEFGSQASLDLRNSLEILVV